MATSQALDATSSRFPPPSPRCTHFRAAKPSPRLLASHARSQDSSPGAGGEGAPQALDGPDGAVLGGVLHHEPVAAVGQARTHVGRAERGADHRGDDLGVGGHDGAIREAVDHLDQGERQRAQYAAAGRDAPAQDGEEEGLGEQPAPRVEQGGVDRQGAVILVVICRVLRHRAGGYRGPSRCVTARSTISPMIVVRLKSFGV